MKYIVDRFEGDIAVLEAEDLTHINVAKDLLPSKTREGDVLALSEGEYRIIMADTVARRDRIRAKMRNLMQD